jgi:hypothetical protein
VTTVGDANGFPIWVPDDTTSLTPLRTPFVTLANSVNTQLGHLKAQSTSRIGKTGVFTPTANWTIASVTTTVVAEILVSIYISLTRKTSALSVPSTGNLTNAHVGDMDGTYNAIQPVPLASGASGRGAHGYIDTGGAVYLSAVVGGGDIAINEGISLGGMYPLANLVASNL